MKKIITFLCALFIHFTLEARIYFIHIPKTAGTTLRYLLAMQVEAHEIYPYHNQRDAKELIHHALVLGHLPYWLCAKLDPDFEKAFKITVLRDPIERYLSFLRAKKSKNPRHRNLESVMKERFSPHNPYKLGLIDNALCRFLATRPNLQGEELLSSAKEGLEKMDRILFFDHFTQDVIELFAYLNIPLKESDIPKMNVSNQELVTPQLLEKIRQENLWDIKLYQYAQEKIKKTY